jgi:serine/threonine-protein kinase
MSDFPRERWKQIEALFCSALELQPEERAAFVARAANGDDELRREVEALLEQHLLAADYLETPAAASFYKRAEEDSSARMIGRRVGAYRLLKEVGRGGMGSVFLAERADGEYRQRVAVKIVRPEMDTDLVLRRFRNERQILAELDHPNIARLLDGGTTEDGLPYFVMEYIDGETLTEYADAHRLTIAERLRLFQQVCSAVDYAHEQQVIHRDLKPSNILVTSQGVVKLLDFGIAKLLNPEMAHSRLTSTSLFFRPMTPEYASPEQVQGFKVTTASDQYSLGLLLYELLTGHKAYRLRKAAPLEMARVICESEPERPSTVVTRDEGNEVEEGKRAETASTELLCRNRRTSLPDLRRELERGLDSIVLKALSKEPRGRYASVAELSADIDRYLAGSPAEATARQKLEARTLPNHARSETRAHAGEASTAKRSRSLPWKAALVAALAVAVMVAPLLYWRSARNSSAPLSSIAVLPFVNAGGNSDAEWLSDGITESIIDNLSHLPRLTVKARSSVFRYKGKETDPQEIGRELNVQAVLTGRISQHGDELSISTELVNARDGTHIWGAQYTRKPQDIPRLQEEIARDVSERLRLKLSGEDEQRLAKNYTSNTEAYQLYLQGKYYWNKRTPEGAKKSIELFQQALAKDPNYALAYAGLSNCYFSATIFEVVPYAEGMAKTKAAALKAVELDDTLAEAHAALGVALAFVDWNWKDSEAELRRALELNPGSAETHFIYSEICLKVTGRLSEALLEGELARSLDPLSITINTNLGRNYVYAHQPDKGLELLRQVLDMDATFRRAHIGLIEAYIEKGMYEEALKELKEYEKLPAGREDGTAIFLYSKMGQREKALKALEALKAQPQTAPSASMDLATAYAGLGDNDQAFYWLERAYSEHNFQVTFLKFHPIFAALHSDPRYAEMMRRLNLTP